MEEESSLQRLHHKFITASHILHHHAIVDAYGHLSVRHPSDPALFIMSRSIAPATISNPADLIVYRVADASPIDPAAAKGYAERHIHSEIYRRHPQTQAVVHSHADAVVAFGVTDVPLRPVYHMAGFLGKGCPVYDIAEFWRQGDVADMLVRSEHTGAGLAACFDGGVAAVLMRGHGMTVVGNGIEDVVLRSVYTAKNAVILRDALTMGAVLGGGAAVKFLSEDEACAATEMTRWSAQRPWGLWVREVEACGLYVNSA